MAETLPELLRARDRFLLTGHENPDGDCVGAQAALFHLLAAIGKRVTILNPDPLAGSFDFLRRHTPFEHHCPGAPVPDAEVIVLLDCSRLERVGALGDALRSKQATIAVIDHHVGSEQGDGEVCLVDHRAPATGALVHGLFGQLGVPLSAEAAEGVFLSLVSDTGWFRHSNTDAVVLALAAELARAGVDVSAMYDRLYRRQHPETVAIMAHVLGGSSQRLQGRLAMAAMDRGMTERAGRVGFDTDLVLEPLRSVAGVEVVALLKERSDGRVRLSLRATHDVDVERIAAALGGGGHKKAAGATLGPPLAEAFARVETLVRAALEDGDIA